MCNVQISGGDAATQLLMVFTDHDRDVDYRMATVNSMMHSSSDFQFGDIELTGLQTLNDGSVVSQEEIILELTQKIAACRASFALSSFMAPPHVKSTGVSSTTDVKTYCSELVDLRNCEIEHYEDNLKAVQLTSSAVDGGDSGASRKSNVEFSTTVELSTSSANLMLPSSSPSHKSFSDWRNWISLDYYYAQYVSAYIDELVEFQSSDAPKLPGTNVVPLTQTMLYKCRLMSLCGYVLIFVLMLCEWDAFYNPLHGSGQYNQISREITDNDFNVSRLLVCVQLCFTNSILYFF
jgi:hypothetical protein